MLRVLLFMSILTGCVENDVYPFQVVNITQACADHNGWAVIYENGTGRCTDGTFVLSSLISKAKP